MRLLFRNGGFSLGYPGNSIRDSIWDTMFNSFDHCVMLDSVLALGCNWRVGYHLGCGARCNS
jgi:hypothetical protein